MVKENLLALLIYVTCRPKWSDDIVICAKLDIEDKKLMLHVVVPI